MELPGHLPSRVEKNKSQESITEHMESDSRQISSWYLFRPAQAHSDFAPTNSQASRIAVWELLPVSNHKRKADSPLRLTPAVCSIDVAQPWLQGSASQVARRLPRHHHGDSCPSTGAREMAWLLQLSLVNMHMLWCWGKSAHGIYGKQRCCAVFSMRSAPHAICSFRFSK